MKLKTLALMGAICTSLVFTSCKKNDDNDNDDGDAKKEEPTPATVVGTWKITALTVTFSGSDSDFVNDFYGNWPECKKDNLLRFSADKIHTDLAGATKCSPMEPDSEAVGTWALSNNNTKLVLTFATYDITTLNATTLKIQETGKSGGSPVTTRITFTRQ